MTPASKRTILTSKTTGRRYFVVRTMTRPNGRRYFVCANPDCKSRVLREADLYCRLHSKEQRTENENTPEVSMQSDQNENLPNEIMDEETSATAQATTETESSLAELNVENGNSDSVPHDDDGGEETINDSSALSSNSWSNREVHVNDATGVRSFRDHTGRRRYLCMRSPCTTILKRQSDFFCRLHLSTDEPVNMNNNKDERRKSNRSSAPLLPRESSYHSPFISMATPIMATTSTENIANGDQSDEYETPKKSKNSLKTRIGTHRSFRDASGKIRFLCSISTCQSRVARQTDYYCRRHQLEFEINSLNIKQTENKTNSDVKGNAGEKIEVESNGHRPSTPEPELKKRKIETSSTFNEDKQQIVVATTTLLEDQWNDVVNFLRQFPDVQLSANLNINNSTTHLLVDDRETHLHCTITKKIVQAAARRHIFILSIRWINECMRTESFVDEHSYEIRSDSHTTLRSSAQNFQNASQFIFSPTSPYLYAFAIECRQCQGSINRSELIELIQLTGAQLFQNEQAVDILIVLCDINDKNLAKLKEKYAQAPASSIKFVTSDFLLKSIIKFEIQDLDKYAL